MVEPRTLYEVLDLTPEATAVDVEAGFQRAMEAFSDDAMASYALYSPDEADRVRKEIRLAFEVLSRQDLRHAYDSALSTAQDKADATLSFTTRYTAQQFSGTTSMSDSSASGPVRLVEEPARAQEKRPVMIASPVEEMQAPPPAPVEPAATQPPAAATQPPAAATQPPAAATQPPAPVAVQAPAAAPAVIAPAPPAPTADLPPLPPAGPALDTSSPQLPAIPTSIPVSMTPTEPPAPAPSAPPAAARFKRVRLDDDSVSLQVARPVDRAAAVANPPAAGQEVLALTDDGEVNGALLLRLREARGISIKAMSDVTKVSVHYLKAMEANAFSELPTRVYLRGFLIQYARALRVNPERLASGYLAFADRYRTQLR